MCWAKNILSRCKSGRCDCNTPSLPFVLLQVSPNAPLLQLQATTVHHTDSLLCKCTSDSPGDGLVENTPASARHQSSWQLQSGQPKINPIAREVLASCKQICTHWSLFFLVFHSVMTSLIPSYGPKTHYHQDSMGELGFHLVWENQQLMGNGRVSPSYKTVAYRRPLGVIVLSGSWILVRSLSAHL